MPGRLKPEDEKRLQMNYNYLSKEIDAKFLLPDLFSKFVITYDNKEEIENQPSRQKRTEILLNILLHAGPGDNYNIFCEVLNQHYEHAARRLRETDIAVSEIFSTSDFFSWYDSLPDSVKDHVISGADASRLSQCFDANWRHVMIDLQLPIVMIDHEVQNSQYNGVTNVITSLLNTWKQRSFPNAKVKDLILVLQKVHMEATCTIDWKVVQGALKKITQ